MKQSTNSHTLSLDDDDDVELEELFGFRAKIESTTTSSIYLSRRKSKFINLNICQTRYCNLSKYKILYIYFYYIRYNKLYKKN